jgi:DNA-binding winged helix-turn-helix (wHTH) protein
MFMTPGVVPMQESYEPVREINHLLTSGRYIYLGPFQIDQQRQEITKDGERLKLQGKVYQVLMALLEKPCEVVTREEIRQRLWPAETHVNYDANVNTTVNKLRLALGDSSDKPVYIETIPRKGYCLLVRPQISESPDSPAQVPAKFEEAIAAPIKSSQSSKMGIWIVAGVIGLIVASMLIGAALTRVFITHMGPVSRWP